MNAPENIPQTEENIPLLADMAVKLAIKNALESGRSVAQAKDGHIIERSADGTERVVKAIDLPVFIKSGTVFPLR